MPTDTEIAQRAETLAEIRNIRALVGEALFLELREGQASAEGSDDWEHLNGAKWFAYERASWVLPGGSAILERSEDAFLAMLNEFHDATDSQIARKMDFPW